MDNYLFTKKRRLSVTGPSSSLGEALQPPLKKYALDHCSILLLSLVLTYRTSCADNRSRLMMLALQDSSLCMKTSSPRSRAPLLPQRWDLAPLLVSHPPPIARFLSSSTRPLLRRGDPLLPSLRAVHCRCKHRRVHSPSLFPADFLLPAARSVSFILTLLLVEINLLSDCTCIFLFLSQGGSSFSIDPAMALSGWAYPQAETTPSQPGGGGRGSFLYPLDPRISFDWNLWSNDEHLREATAADFLDF